MSSAAIFFSVILADLSGAINVLLFLIVRPQLLLFPRPEELAEPNIELLNQGNSSAVFTDVEKFQHSPEPSLAAQAAQLVDESPRSGTVQARVNSRRMSDDIDI